MRISVQARRPSGTASSGGAAGALGERWQRSVYLDQTSRNILIPFIDMTPIGPTSRPNFDPAQIDMLLFVVDTTNTTPGTGGTFEIGDLRVQH